MLDLKMKETCRICGRELCGNQRRWIFHPTAKLNLQVLLSHALGQEVMRDGRGEFACSKCTFMLDRMYRFDTVIARVEALSIERLQRLLQEKHRLRHCIGGLYRKNNSGEATVTVIADEEENDGMVDISGLTHAKYCALLQDDLVYSFYESWAEDGDGHHPNPSQCPPSSGSEVTTVGSHRCSSRRCRGCSHLRVADSDYEAVCKVPRKLARSISCGPSTRYSASVGGNIITGDREDPEKKDTEDTDEPPSSVTLVPSSQALSRTSDSDRTLAGRASSSPSVTSLEPAEDSTQQMQPTDAQLSIPIDQGDELIYESLSEEPMETTHSLSHALSLLQTYAVYRPVQCHKGSKLPVLKQCTGYRDFPISLTNSVLGIFLSTPEAENEPNISTPDLPVIRLNVGADLDVESLEELYKEYPQPPPHQSLVEEQQTQLNQYECAAGQCVSELQKAQLQVQSLQAKFHESEANNMKLQEKLNEMDCELRSLRQSSHSQERTIQGLSDCINTKDNEAQELYQMLEGQNTTLCKLREMVQRNQNKAPEGTTETLTVAQLQDELVAVQSSLFSVGLELEASQRSLRQSQRREADLLKFKDRLVSDLQETVQHREVTEKHNQTLHCTLQKTCSELQTKEAALKETEAETYRVVQEKERTIAQLKQFLEDKERQLQDYSEMLESLERYKQRDVLVEKLRERIKERDKALEHSIDDKFHCLEEHESQVRSLQLALREKERDLERLRCILSNNEDTITSLDSLVRSKDLELEQAAEAYRNLQWVKQHSEEKDKHSLKERDSIISQLQAALQARSQETQDLTAALVAHAQTAPNEVIEELKARLCLKEKLFQEMLSDRSRQSNEHLSQIQDLLNTISSKDQYQQDYSYRMWLVITERTDQLHEIQKQLSLREQELCKLKKDKELGGENLKSLLKEKESLIKELIQSKEEALESSTKETEAKTSALQEELQLVLKKEREAREELSALRLSLGHQQTAQHSSAAKYQCVLDQLLSEYNSLNDALRAEKRLYQSLSQIHNKTDSSTDKIQALHTELDSVQALRGQLEEVLARTCNMALRLERAAKSPADLGELSSVEEKDSDDDCSSEEFSDSIEEQDCKATMHSCTSVQASEIQQLEEERTTLETELEEIQSQLERDGFSSLSQMRSTLRKLQQENCALKESHNQIDIEHCLSGQESEDELQTEEEEDKESDEEEESPFGSDQHQKRPNTLNLSSHNGNVEGVELPAWSKSPERWQDLEEDLREEASRLHSDLALSCQENRELQERLMVSEATVHAQADQLKDYRDLLTETSVKQASKHVQVDLQDLGYETCGRSENEAERGDASSPEFDDLEMCTALSQHQDYEGEARGWYAGNSSHTEPFKIREDSSSLQHLVQDLRSQLTHCHKVIRGLQMRVRSLSNTSDYASSLERTPRKVNWALAKSPVPSGVEEDEGWMSDPQGTRSGPSRNKELQELMERVATLETQLRNSRKDNKDEDANCATWPGKYNSLIQAQARELSNLRQRIREGQGVCHILTQHLGDTTKTFEELLRSNDIDYYMGQSFREQLSQSTALAQRVVTKISGRDCNESCDDKTATLLALRLSKELQQKDKIIESLHSKLQQHPDTPSSCHALSETTDQSDRTSLVSDEFRGTEDLELCSEADGQEYLEEHRQHPGQFGSEQSVFPSPYSHRPLKSSNSCPNMLCSARFAGAPLPQHSFLSHGPDVWGKERHAAPRPRALSVNAARPELDVLYEQVNEQSRGSFSLGDHNQLSIIDHNQLSHHAFQQYQLGMPDDYSLKSDSGLVTGGLLWDTENKAPPVGSYSGLSEHHAGMHLIEEHLQEVKCLRQRLEESIGTNERLRQQLEERLSHTGRDGGAPTNIYIQGLDTVTQLSNEIRVLKEENLGLQSRLQASTGEEAGQLRDAVFTAHARLKQAELEAEQWKEELRRVQIHSQEQGQQLNALRQERQMNQEQTNRLQHDLSLLQQQLCESRDLIHSLQGELQVYDQVCARTRTNKGFLSELPILPVELAELLGEVRSLRAQLQNSIQENSTLKQLELHKQLEQKLGSPRTLCALTASPQRESFYKRQLLHDPAPSPPVRDIGLFNCGSPGPPYSDLEDCHSTTNDMFDPHAELEGEAPDGSFANCNGRHVIGHVDDFTALQQQILEGCSLVHQIDCLLQSCQGSSLMDEQTQGPKNVLDCSCITILFANTKTLRQIFEEAMSLLKMFWRAALPSTDNSIQSLKKEQCLQEEILSLKLRVSEQEEVLKGTIQRLRSTSRTKESMEHFIVSQLSRTRDVLKKARTNLEKNELRLSSLSSSSSPYTAEEPGGAAREWSSDYGGMTSNQRLATRKRTSQCLL
ncbi:myomegalin isoform X3 [Eucyclogobius newberryi]|uniref:myomegalin isoform X3 n=1 Tax=Eucyclogobius newberryi TaxID=166745 RepID=UPI003B5A800C